MLARPGITHYKEIVSSANGSPAWPRATPARPGGGEPDDVAVNITVPSAGENRDRALADQWRRHGGEDLPVPPMRLPRSGEGAYRVRIRQRALGDCVLEDQYSDAAAGRTGGLVDHRAHGVIVHLTTGGQWRFASERRRFTVRPGLLFVRDNEIPWDFEIDRGTRSHVFQLPADDFRRALRGRPAFLVEQDAPAARLLLGHLDRWAGLPAGLSPEAGRAARSAGLELFRGLVNDQVIDDEEFSAALARAAMDRIDERLLTDPDLSPAAIAVGLHVSVRTLHRAFAGEDVSVMGYVRGRRLDRARAELLSSTVTVSETAARWHFTDASHFVKCYRRRFGTSPAGDRRQLTESGTTVSPLLEDPAGAPASVSAPSAPSGAATAARALRGAKARPAAVQANGRAGSR